MAYKRKTRDVYELQSYYGPEYGWETLFEEDTRKEALDQLRCYRENEPEYPHRIKKRRVKIEGV